MIKIVYESRYTKEAETLASLAEILRLVPEGSAIACHVADAVRSIVPKADGYVHVNIKDETVAIFEVCSAFVGLCEEKTAGNS